MANPEFRTAKSSRIGFSFPDSPSKKRFGRLLLPGSSGAGCLDYLPYEPGSEDPFARLGHLFTARFRVPSLMA